MNTVQAIIARARRRQLIDRWLRQSARGILAGLIISLAAVLMHRALGEVLSPLWLIVPPIAGLVAGMVLTSMTRPSRLATAITLDRHLNLKDRLGTAVSLRSPIAEGFEALALADAERAAAGLPVAAAVPIRAGREWIRTALAAAAVIGSLMFVPSGWFERSRPQTVADDPSASGVLVQSRQAMAETVDEALTEVDAKPQATEEEAVSPQQLAMQEQLQTLDDLARQMEGSSDEQELSQLRDEAAATIDRLAEDLAAEADREQQSLDELAREFSQAAPPGAKGPMSAAEFTEALKRGDFGAAAEQIEKAMQKAASSSPQEKHALSEHLDKTAKNLTDEAAAAEVNAIDDSREIDESLREQGLDDPQIEDVKQARDPAEAAQRELEKRGVDPEVAQRLVNRLEEWQKQQQSQQDAQEKQTELARELEEAARELREPPPPPPDSAPPPAPPSQPSDQDEQNESPEQTEQGEQEEQSQTKGGSSETPSNPKPSTAVEEKPGEPSTPAGEQSPGKPKPQGQPQPVPTPDPDKPPEPTGPKPGADPQPDPNGPKLEPSPGPAPSPGGKPDPRPQEGEQQPGNCPEGTSPNPKPDGDGNKPGTKSQATKKEDQAGGDKSGMKPGGKPGQGLVEKLREFAGQREQSGKQQAASRKLREAAKQLAENLSEDEKRELQRWASRQAKNQPEPPRGRGRGVGDPLAEPGRTPGELSTAAPPQGEPFEAHDVDLSDEQLGEQLLAQWLADESGAPAPQGSQPAAARIRAAQRAAEQAVNDSTVPPRYHKTIQRFFGRLKSQPAELSPPPPADKK